MCQTYSFKEGNEDAIERTNVVKHVRLLPRQLSLSKREDALAKS